MHAGRQATEVALRSGLRLLESSVTESRDEGRKVDARASVVLIGWNPCARIFCTHRDYNR